MFTRIATALRAKYKNPKIMVSQEETPVNATFPCCTVVETDSHTYSRSQDAALKEHHANLLYTINAYSALQSGSRAQARAIMEDVDAIMQELGFTRTQNMPMPNINTTIARRTAQYRAVCSEDHRIYRR